jgi:hypothetical protein
VLHARKLAGALFLTTSTLQSILIWLAIILEGVTLHYFQMGVLMGIQLLNALICIYRINKTDEAVVLTSKADKGPAATYQRDVACQVVDSPLLVPTLGNDRGTTGKCHVNPHSIVEVDQVCLPAVEVDEVALTGGEPPEHEENTGASTDTVFVTQLSLADPYGDTGVYTGALSKSTGMPNGKGRLEYDKKEDRWYDGNWIHGRWNGHGRISNGDGDFYEGGLKNDHKHGTAVMRFADGRVFEGEYIRGQMIQGKMTYQDGSVYEGCLADGMRHGHGKYIFIEGSKYEGEFEKGHIQGRGQMIWNDGGWYLGEFFEGEMHGNGMEIRPDCSLRHDGEWSRGHPIRSTNTASQPIQPPNTAAQKNSHSHIPDGSEVIRG